MVRTVNFLTTFFHLFSFYYSIFLALLKAVYVVDTDALLEVIEETEAAKQLSLELRDRVLERLELSGMLYFLSLTQS